MNKHTFILCVISALLMIACQSQQISCPVVDIDNPTGTIDLKITDLLDNVTIVPLETNDDLLLTTTGGTSFTITNRYILVSTREKLLQFDRQGNYMRTLAHQGNGPNEFNMILRPLTDEMREIFYYSDGRSNSPVVSIDLNSGKFLPFPNPNLSSSSIREIDAGGNIYGFSSAPVVTGGAGGVTVGSVSTSSSSSQKGADSLELAFKYNPAENSTITFAGNHSFVTDSRTQMFVRQGNDVSLLYFPYSDTLYRLEGSNMIPQYVIQLKNQMTDTRRSGNSNALSFLDSGNGSSIITKIERQLTVGDGYISMIPNILTYLFLDKKGALSTIKTLTIDPVAVTIDMENYLKLTSEQRRSEFPATFPLHRVSGSWGYYAVEGHEMAAFIDKALKGNQLSAAQRKALEEVATGIDDDSNPVLIIGKIK